MTPRLAHIRRHPIKGIGSEALESAMLSPEGALLGDRAWALLTAAAPDIDDWQPRRNFLVVANGPALAKVTARADADGTITLSRPGADPLGFDPETGAEALRDWIAPLWPEGQPAPARLVRAPGHGMTDIPDPFVSIGNMTTLRILSEHAGHDLDIARFRINFWIEGLAPWEEFDLLDRTFTIGAVPFTGVERIERCRAPEANPATGRRDTEITRLLYDRWGHRDFGVYAEVVAGGTVALGDPVTVAP